MIATVNGNQINVEEIIVEITEKLSILRMLLKAADAKINELTQEIAKVDKE